MSGNNRLVTRLKTREEEAMSRLKEKYKKEVVANLMQNFGYKNVLAVPKLEKVVINMGVGEATNNSKAMDAAVNDLTLITGQRPVVTRAKRSIAAFKLRQGMMVGCKVTLRGNRMYDFVDKLFNVALPRVRDFRGVPPKSFDGRGNYTLGIKEQLIFPEIDYDKIDKARGMDIIFVTTAQKDEEAKELLKLLGMPFRPS
jgi:large subunit ribosomal protein L5